MIKIIKKMIKMEQKARIECSKWVGNIRQVEINYKALWDNLKVDLIMEAKK